MPDDSVELPGLRVDLLVERAVSEQVTEQRMLRQALDDMDDRLSAIERLATRGLVALEHHIVGRLDLVERATADRLARLEAEVGRVAGAIRAAEERLADRAAHLEHLSKAQFDALRAGLEAAVERMAQELEHTQELLGARLEASRTALAQAVGGLAKTVERAERSTRGQPSPAVERSAPAPVLVRGASRASDASGAGNGSRHPEPRSVAPEPEPGEVPPLRRRVRPLRAQRAH